MVFISLSYRLPTALYPEYYNITLWLRLSRDPNTGLYIFTGNDAAFEPIEVAGGGETTLFIFPH